jgi:hypothetical protein
MIHAVVTEGDLAAEVATMVAGMVVVAPALGMTTMIAHAMRFVRV